MVPGMLSNRLISAAGLAVICGACACGDGKSPQQVLDPPTDSLPVKPPTPPNPPNPPPPQQGLAPTYDGRLRAPADLQVTLFARVSGIRALAVGPDGAVYASRPNQGSITRLVDADGDGVAEAQTTALQGLDRPHGMTFHGNWMYVANTGSVVRFALDGNGVPTGSPQTIGTYSFGAGHWTRTVIVGPDGGVYVSIGSSCNVCIESNPDRAAVVRFDRDGGGKRVFASGLRNAVGMAVHPTTGEIWVSQNERDDITPNHQDLPPEEINILRDGADYGWPYCHSDRVPNPEYNDATRCANTEPPALMMQAHSAPLGMAFLNTATMLPSSYRGDLLVAFHGSWNRDVPTGAKVVRVRVSGGRPTSYEDFIIGWQTENGSRWGRPVDVAVARDGSVLISDDMGDAIWRVTSR
jgi:glucose/arabinose dehydrogenase